MPMEDILLEVEDLFEKSINHYKTELVSVRTGRASPTLVEGLHVDCYGVMSPLKSVAQVSAPEPQMLAIKPFSPDSLQAIIKAFQASDLGFNPISDGKLIRVPIPPLSEERRKKLVSHVKELGEKAKLTMRNARRDANKTIDKEEKEGVITEDQAKKGKEELNELIKKYESEIDTALSKKTDDLMTV